MNDAQAPAASLLIPLDKKFPCQWIGRGTKSAKRRLHQTLFKHGISNFGETGNIKANIFGANVTVAGKIEGNIVAKGTLEVLASSVITGDVRCEKLTVETGAVLRGNVGGLEDAAAPQLEGAETK